MNRALNQILEKSACLTKVQLMSYVKGRLIEEEVYAVETHLNSCLVCSAAIDGMLHHGLEAVEAVAEMDGSFLKKHFEDIQPRIHLNSVAPAVHLRAHRKKETPAPFPIRTVAGLMATGLAVFCIFWVLNKIAANSPASPAPANLQTTTQETTTPPVGLHPVENQTKALPATQETVATAPTVTAAMPATENEEIDKVTAHPVTSAQVAAQSNPDPLPASEEKATLPKKEAPKLAPVIPALPGSEKTTTPEKEITTEEAAPAPAKAQATNLPLSGTSVSEQQQFQHTITSYKKDLKDPDIEKRNLARLASAEAYRGLGQKEKATELLEQIMNEGGPHKGEARRALRKLRRER